MTGWRAVIFDWRGTLVTTLTSGSWVRYALESLGRDTGPDVVADLTRRLDRASGNRLDAPDIDTDADLHRETYYRVFADAHLDDSLADALYAVESDSRYNQFAADVETTLLKLVHAGCRVGILSDIHFDLRFAFAENDMDELVQSFVLSFEYGVQKPDPRIFRLALSDLGTAPEETLMVGDRASHDGAAVEVGMPTLLLPPLATASERRLDAVAGLVTARGA